jgi:NAD(P)-dependent dehydrogenase (short-subunit alcohol dehydrogenase family)
VTHDSQSLVIVTGGRRGIGAAVVDTLVEVGTPVVILDIEEAAARHGARAQVWSHRIDVSDDAAVADVVAGIEDEHGPVSGLVNAAGVLGKMHAPERLRMADWDREMSVDLRGTYVMCREVGSRMARRRSGAITNIASVAGMTSAPVHGYGPAKAAVINLTMTLAAEWGPSNVRVNAVSPGFTRTPALEAGLAAGVLSAEHMARSAALQRLVEPAEVAQTVVWLLGPAASGITGANIPVDCGFLAGVTWQAYSR